MPTISGLKRRGYTPESIRNFAERVGVAKRDSINDVSLLEFSVREDLNEHANRAMAVLEPLKITITNYDAKKVEELRAANHPKDESKGTRIIPFSREIYVEQNDFQEVPHKKFHRLTEGSEVRLRFAYIIKCEKVIKDNDGNVIELECTYDPATKSGEDKSNKKVKGTIHWVSAKHAVEAEVKLYDRLFSVEFPEEDKTKDFTEFINSDSLKVIKNSKLEPSLVNAKVGDHYQFERNGYFCLDSKESRNEKLVFNRTVTLRDSWSKIANN
jgi:glutaminyl-tRNA synthetase